MPSKIRSIFLCESVFQDTNGRWNMIGTYTGNVVVSSFPIDMRNFIFMQVEPDSLGPISLEFLLDGEIFAKAEATLKIRPDATENLDKFPLVTTMIGPFDFTVEEACDFSIRFVAEDGRKRTVLKKKILIKS